MANIYVSEPDAINMDILRDLFKDSDHKVYPGTPNFDGSKEQDFEAVIFRTETNITAHIRERFPGLNAVIRVGTGLDNVDLDFCKAQGIKVYNAPGANADAVSDYTVGMIMFALRKLYNLTAEEVEAWNRFGFVGQSMREQTVGIVGFGNIGRQIHKKLSGFDCKGFLAYDPYLSPEDMPDDVKLVGLNELLAGSTVVSLHLPLTEETTHLVNADNIALIQEGAVLINASRGGIVDEEAVIPRLKEDTLVYVADAVEGEPSVNPKLLECQNAVVTPHIASLTTSAQDDMIKVAISNFLNDKPFKFA